MVPGCGMGEGDEPEPEPAGSGDQFVGVVIGRDRWAAAAGGDHAGCADVVELGEQPGQGGGGLTRVVGGLSGCGAPR